MVTPDCKRKLEPALEQQTPSPPCKVVKLEVKEEEQKEEGQEEEEIIDVDSSDVESPGTGPAVTGREVAVGRARAARYGMGFQDVWHEAHGYCCRKHHWRDDFLMVLGS